MVNHYLGVSGNLHSKYLTPTITAPDAVIGAIIGDLAGSRYEFSIKKPESLDDIQLEHIDNTYTDDTVLTVMLYKSAKIMKDEGISDPHEILTNFTVSLKNACRAYPKVTWGSGFKVWGNTPGFTPSTSYGNGSAMRVGFTAMYDDVNEAKMMATLATLPSHYSVEGIKGAECVAECINAAKHDPDKSKVKGIMNHYYPMFNDTVESLYETYTYTELCRFTVPQAIQCFLESSNFEDAIKKAIYIGGDSDTVAAITGSIAGTLYPIPHYLKEYVELVLPGSLSKYLYD